jgi:hypothetical protein
VSNLEGIGTLLLGLASVGTLVLTIMSRGTIKSTHTLVNSKMSDALAEIKDLKDRLGDPQDGAV